MGRKREAVFIGIGILAGLALSGPAAQAAEVAFTARPTTQTFYVSGQRVEFEAYQIHGNNFVKLRDIGRAVDFGVTYDADTNTVHINPDAPYTEEVTAPVQPLPSTPAPQAITEETVRAVMLPQPVAYLGRCQVWKFPQPLQNPRLVLVQVLHPADCAAHFLVLVYRHFPIPLYCLAVDSKPPRHLPLAESRRTKLLNLAVHVIPLHSFLASIWVSVLSFYQMAAFG